MTDQVVITWTDDTGTYADTYLIENPTLAEVKELGFNPMMMPMTMMPGAKAPSDAEFYANLSLQMVNQVLQQAHQRRQQQAMAAVPPVSVISAETKE